MKREDYAGIPAFLAVAEEHSFTRAAAKLGVSQSALSQTVRRLEERLDLHLLARTTRSVSLTEAGECLVQRIGPHLEEIGNELSAMAGERNTATGTVRITTGEHAATTVLWPRLKPFLAAHPGITLEINTAQSLTDIVAERYDAGVRFGEQVAKDMIAVRIGPDIRFVVVAAPRSLEGRKLPRKPQDLVDFNCINLRLPTHGGLYAWELAKGGREVKVRVDGRLVLNNLTQILEAALFGLGLAYLPEDMVAQHVAKGRLATVLDDWCQPFAGYHLCYPSRRHQTPAFAAVAEVLRYRR